MKASSPVRIVNVFARVDFGIPFDLQKLPLRLPNAEYEPESAPGLVVRTDSPRSCITIYRSGVARCTGCKSPQDVDLAIMRVWSLMRDVGEVVPKPTSEIRNIVCVFDVGQPVDLARLAQTERGLVEYEPEQFPGAILRPPPSGTVLLFGSGRVVVTGIKAVSEAEYLVTYVRQMVHLS